MIDYTLYDIKNVRIIVIYRQNNLKLNTFLFLL